MKLLLLFIPILLVGQVPPASQSPAKRIGPSGDTLPLTPCVSKSLFYRSGATDPGQYICVEGNWVLPGSGSAIVGPPGPAGSVMTVEGGLELM